MDVPHEPAGRGKTLRWASLAQQSTEPLFVLNARRRLLFANAAWEQAAGLSFAHVRGQVCKERGPLAAFAPPGPVIDGHAAQVRRRLAQRWCDVIFLPWKRGDRVHVVIGKLLELSADAVPAPALPDPLLQWRAEQCQVYSLDPWLADSPQARLWLEQIRLAVGSTLPVLIEGPPGAGKQWLARTIHQLGPRREEFFAVLDVGVLSSSLVWQCIEQARECRIGGVLVRHAERMQADDQRRWLAFLDEPPPEAPRCFFSISSSAATLLPEFHHRIRPLTIQLAGLKERGAEFETWLHRLLPEASRLAGAQVTSITEEARTILKLHDWPRNLNELREVLHSACGRARGSRLDSADLPLYLRQSPTPVERPLDLDAILEKVERRLIEAALEKAKNNKSKAAELLGIWRARLVRRAEQWGL
jgi:DNA-binding NtrC family response regulator